jgi:hypothetical protein
VPLPICSFTLDVTLASNTPAAYETFLCAVQPLESIWAPRRGSAWVLFSDTRGRSVLPIWLSHRAGYQFASGWCPSIEHAPVSLTDFVCEWLCGLLPSETWVGVSVVAPTSGILVAQHRLWADLGTTVDFLPLTAPRARSQEPGTAFST